jgi:hypothetical protein
MTDPKIAHRPLLEVVACFALGIGMGLIPWLFRHRFYFHDDMQHQHMPIFVHIGRMLRAGEAPFLSLSSFTSGNLLAEYQFALFILSVWRFTQSAIVPEPGNGGAVPRLLLLWRAYRRRLCAGAQL